ncbi:MAG: gliding motility protein GldC [Flavobacteriales bacterium]|nr:gliding motility protein GldC [Flavobacteriales bacterium]MCB9449304.1 gliding motility protein GldC [Flavobacteriales bacterium]
MKKKESQITVKVGLDENQVPDTISWQATDADMENEQSAKAMIMSMWDPQDGNAMRIDLWTKDMLVDDMKVFMFQTLLSLADTLEKATGERNLAEDLRDYCAHFADKSGFSKPEDAQ